MAVDHQNMLLNFTLFNSEFFQNVGHGYGTCGTIPDLGRGPGLSQARWAGPTFQYPGREKTGSVHDHNFLLNLL